MSANAIRLSLIAAIAAGAAYAGGPLPSPAQAETKLLFNIFVPRQHPFMRGIFTPWAKNVEKATNGNVKVEFPAASLAPPPKQWSMVTKGIADVAMLANAFERKRLELVQVGQLPFTTPNAEKSSVALQRTHEKFFGPANEYKGIKLMGLWTISGANIQHRSKAITKVSDLDGEKMWALAGIPKATMDSMGSVVVTVPGVKMFSVVSKGVVNGLSTSDYALMVFKVMKYVKHVTVVPGGLSTVSFSMLLSEKKWNKLSKADRDAIASVSGEKVSMGASMVDKLDAKANGIAAKQKVNRFAASPEFIADIKKRTAFLEENWLKLAAKKGVDGKAALAYYRDQLK